MDDPAWDRTTFAKFRNRLPVVEMARKFLAVVAAHPKVNQRLSSREAGG